jgi:hypothetical protein
MNNVYIDKFFVPATSIEEFLNQVKKTQRFLRSLPGYISGDTYIRQDGEGNYNLVTTAVWENEEAIGRVQETLNEEYKRTGFDRAAFTQRLGIRRDGEVYQHLAN